MVKDTTIKVLQAVCAVAKPGEYIILSRSELAAGLPAGTERREIDSAMMELQADDYIAVRYSDGDVYCLTVQTKGFVACEKIKERDELRREEEQQRMKEKALLTQKSDDLSEIAAATSDVLPAPAAEEENKKPAVSYRPGFSLKRLFWACFGGAVLGGLVAGSIITILAKILF